MARSTAALAAALALLLAVPALAERVPGTVFERFVATDAGGRAITYYLSNGAAPRPLALVIQGSGCGALFRPLTSAAMSAVGYHNVFRSVGGDRYRVLAVEKPGARPVTEPPSGGQADGCPSAFLAEHTVEGWAEALHAALADARRRPGVVANGTLVIGHSEGGVLAARLARLDPGVSHVALLASPGPDPAEELIRWNEARGRSRAETTASIARMRAQADSTAELFLGHPFKRWASFLAADPVADLLSSKARVFAAHGAADTSWPVAAHDALVMRLRGAGRQVAAHRLDGADHSLLVAGQKPPEGMIAIFRRILDWVAS